MLGVRDSLPGESGVAAECACIQYCEAHDALISRRVLRLEKAAGSNTRRDAGPRSVRALFHYFRMLSGSVKSRRPYESLKAATAAWALPQAGGRLGLKALLNSFLARLVFPQKVIDQAPIPTALTMVSKTIYSSRNQETADALGHGAVAFGVAIRRCSLPLLDRPMRRVCYG